MTVVRHRLLSPAGYPLRDRTVFAVLVMPFLNKLSLPDITLSAQSRSDIDGQLTWDLRPTSGFQGVSYYRLHLGGNDVVKYTFQVPDHGPVELLDYLVDPVLLTAPATTPAQTITIMKGDKGDTGETGAASTVAGPIGKTGAVGPAGEDSTVPGPAGADSVVPGPRGAAGLPGADGAQGPTGPRGAASTVPGPQGETGPTGPTGASSTVPGPEGPRGATGLAGKDSVVPGPEGPRGPTGPAGADSIVPGPRGPEGPVGPAGTAATAGGKASLVTALGAGATRDVVVALNRSMASASSYYPVASIGAPVSLLGVVQNQGVVGMTANTVTVRIFNSGLTLLPIGSVTVYVVASD